MTNNLPQGFELNITELPPGFTINPLAMPPGFTLDIQETEFGFREYSAHLPEGFFVLNPTLEDPNVYILNASNLETEDPFVYVLDTEGESVGPQGSIGPRGVTGKEGRIGGRGGRGTIGPRGLLGGRGEHGTIGPRGLLGERGDTGFPGAVGEHGLSGPMGPIGPEGKEGERGLQGEEGDRGDSGPQGDKGERGDLGTRGPMGLRGADGPRGIHGPRGGRGEQGDQGFTGLQGEAGTPAPPLEWEYCAIEEGGRRFEDAGMRFRNPDGTWSKCKRMVGRDGIDGREARPTNVANLAGAGAGGGGAAAPVAGGTTIVQVEGTVSGSGTSTIVTVPVAANEGLKWFLRAQNSVTGSAQSSEIMSHLSGSVVSFDKFSILGAEMDFDIDLTASGGNWIFDITNNVSDPLDIKLSRITAIQ